MEPRRSRAGGSPPSIGEKEPRVRPESWGDHTSELLLLVCPCSVGAGADGSSGSYACDDEELATGATLSIRP